MKIKDLKYKRFIFVLVAFVAILLVFSIVRLVFALNAVHSSFSEDKKKAVEINTSYWGNEEAKQLQKDIYWLEEKLALSKSDSFSLGINLTENLIQVLLKGTTLYQSEILKKSPVDFFQSTDENLYSEFAKISRIDSETVNIPKRPVKKVIAPKDESEAQTVVHDLTIEPAVCWDFTTTNQLRIVVFGVPMNSDSLFVVQSKQDIRKLQKREFFHTPFPKNYTPVLYLWLKDSEAKTIYRAVPEKSKIVFRN